MIKFFISNFLGYSDENNLLKNNGRIFSFSLKNHWLLKIKKSIINFTNDYIKNY